jgi:hypothetical protein
MAAHQVPLNLDNYHLGYYHILITQLGQA